MSASARQPAQEGAAAEHCYHCGLPVPPEAQVSAPVEEIERPFCCTGCKSVCEAIYAAGMEGFYQRTPDGEIFGPPPGPVSSSRTTYSPAVSRIFSEFDIAYLPGS